MNKSSIALIVAISFVLGCICGFLWQKSHTVVYPFEANLYIDGNSITHTSKDCPGVAKINGFKTCREVSISNLDKNNLNSLCSRCFNSEQAEYLHELYLSKK